MEFGLFSIFFLKTKTTRLLKRERILQKVETFNSEEYSVRIGNRFHPLVIDVERLR